MTNPNLDSVDAAPPVEFGKINIIEKPKKVFFYRKIRDSFTDQEESQQDDTDKDIGEIMDDKGKDKDSDVFSCHEQEAARLDPRRFKQVGVGDGRTYLRFIRDSGVKARQLIPIKKVREILIGAFKAELKAARGHYQRPVEQKLFIGGVSKDVENPEELLATIQKKYK